MGGQGCEVIFYGCLFSVEDGAEAAGVSVGGMDCENVTCDYQSSVEGGVEAARVFGRDGL